MTTTPASIRPDVQFREPDGARFSESLDIASTGQISYSSLTCNGCNTSDSESWTGLALITCGIVITAITGMIVFRKLIHTHSH